MSHIHTYHFLALKVAEMTFLAVSEYGKKGFGLEKRVLQLEKML